MAVDFVIVGKFTQTVFPADTDPPFETQAFQCLDTVKSYRRCIILLGCDPSTQPGYRFRYTFEEYCSARGLFDRRQARSNVPPRESLTGSKQTRYFQSLHAFGGQNTIFTCDHTYVCTRSVGNTSTSKAQHTLGLDNGKHVVSCFDETHGVF
jgi:hypothetical protein